MRESLTATSTRNSRGRHEMVNGIRVGVVGVGYWGSKQLRVMGSTPGVERVVAIDARLPLLSGMAHGGAHV